MPSLTVNGEPYAFRSNGSARSSVLKDIEAGGPKAGRHPVEIPFSKDWVQAWDEEIPAYKLTLEQQLGVCKVCFAPAVRRVRHTGRNLAAFTSF
jgi:hypothetical protein